MSGIDESLPFFPLRIAVLTISKEDGAKTDTSGDLLEDRIVASGHDLAARSFAPETIAGIRSAVQEWIDDPNIDLIITNGGTGFTSGDLAPEAIRPLLDREMNGFAVLFHQFSMASVGVATLQSRAFAGQAQETFVFCLPGSSGACRDGWDNILALELDSRHRPCSLVGQIPRLRGKCR